MRAAAWTSAAGSIAAVEHQELLIFGAGGFGREVASWAHRAEWQGRGFKVAGFVDDNLVAAELNGFPVLTLATAAELHPDAGVLGTVGQPRVRERMIAKAAELGLRPTAPLLHPSIEYDQQYVTFGEGVVVCAGSILTVNIEVEPHVQINLDCTVGHDAVLQAYSTLSPGVHISGNVILEVCSFLGTGAVTVQGLPERPLVIGADSVVGAGAVVTKNVAAGVTVVGIPARARP
jgi:sugar O-acyltransferase (sialic acid O-acetyltransferase NeuD family)